MSWVYSRIPLLHGSRIFNFLHVNNKDHVSYLSHSPKTRRVRNFSKSLSIFMTTCISQRARIFSSHRVCIKRYAELSMKEEFGIHPSPRAFIGGIFPSPVAYMTTCTRALYTEEQLRIFPSSTDIFLNKMSPGGGRLHKFSN